MAHVSDSVVVPLGDAAFHSQQEHLVLDSAAGKSELELKKKRLLEELESIIPSFGIKMIDETALVGNEIAKKTNKQSRRRAAKGSGGGKNKKEEKENLIVITNGGGMKNNYSRKEMEALRFVNVGLQRKFWKSIYKRLQSHDVAAMEYDTLVAAHPHNRRDNPPQCLPNKKTILGSVCHKIMDSELQVMEISENVSLVDPSCTHSLMGGDGCSNLEESSEKDDSEDDFASIQRPAFLVEGEPNFDAGAPEDGWEYLRRVRSEANQIPKVKVAKLDRSKLNKEQSAYMPKIPDIPECPEHLLPLKQWEDVFLAEFSALRANLSSLEGSNNLQPVYSLNLLGNNFGESASVMNRDGLLNHSSTSKAIDQPTDLTGEDKDTALPPVNPTSKTCIDQTSSTSPTLPLLSSILAMDYVSRVSMLLKRISLLEPADTITRNDCLWLFALCAAVDAPLHADTSASLRGLLRKCASIRATKTELDEEVVMLNILALLFLGDILDNLKTELLDCNFVIGIYGNGYMANFGCKMNA